jgi:thiol-disulfide isomerase/thioredoxin
MNIIKSLVIITALLLLNSIGYAAKVETTTANQLRATINEQGDRKKVLLFFTSWCPHCKTAIQQIIDSNVQAKVTFVSLDKNSSQLLTFSPSLPDNLLIYHLQDQNEIMSFFSRYGIRYNGSIPYVSVLDEDGELLQDDVSLRQLRKYLR